jgi:hypothetical protein
MSNPINLSKIFSGMQTEARIMFIGSVIIVFVTALIVPDKLVSVLQAGLFAVIDILAIIIYIIGLGVWAVLFLIVIALESFGAVLVSSPVELDWLPDRAELWGLIELFREQLKELVR